MVRVATAGPDVTACVFDMSETTFIVQRFIAMRGTAMYSVVPPTGADSLIDFAYAAALVSM
jgi:hypothetical protein